MRLCAAFKCFSKSFNFLQSLVYNKAMEKEEFEEIIERTLENIPEKFKNKRFT